MRRFLLLLLQLAFAVAVGIAAGRWLHAAHPEWSWPAAPPWCREQAWGSPDDE